jgi:hypothetical protein
MRKTTKKQLLHGVHGAKSKSRGSAPATNRREKFDVIRVQLTVRGSDPKQPGWLGTVVDDRRFTGQAVFMPEKEVALRFKPGQTIFGSRFDPSPDLAGQVVDCCLMERDTQPLQVSERVAVSQRFHSIQQGWELEMTYCCCDPATNRSYFRAATGPPLLGFCDGAWTEATTKILRVKIVSKITEQGHPYLTIRLPRRQ